MNQRSQAANGGESTIELAHTPGIESGAFRLQSRRATTALCAQQTHLYHRAIQNAFLNTYAPLDARQHCTRMATDGRCQLRAYLRAYLFKTWDHHHRQRLIAHVRQNRLSTVIATQLRDLVEVHNRLACSNHQACE